MIESILISAMTLLFSGLITYVIAKTVVRSQKDEIFDEIQDYLSSPEGQQSIRNIGEIFAQGISKGIGLGGKVRGGKTFGVPNEFIAQILAKFMGGKGKEEETKISEEGHSTPSGKFD